jgi:hypothetical protein
MAQDASHHRLMGHGGNDAQGATSAQRAGCHSHHQPLRVWILCLYLMGFNLSNHQIAEELDLNKDDVHQMTCQLRQGVVTKKPAPTLTNVRRRGKALLGALLALLLT